MAKKKVVIETKEKNDTGGCLLDVILKILTGGFWLIVVLIRYLRNNS